MDKYLSYEEHDVLKGNTFFAKYDTVVVPNDWPFESGSWLRVYAGNVVNILEIDPDNDNLVFAMFGKEHGFARCFGEGMRTGKYCTDGFSLSS